MKETSNSNLLPARVWHDSELPIGTIDYIVDLLAAFNKAECSDMELFFAYALKPVYDCMWEGMDINAGHVIYRLSDYISEEERRNMLVYSSKTGSIIEGKCGIEQCDSLQDWREEWERDNPIIPELQTMLPPEKYLALEWLK